ncbi:MAG: hypothetical protein ACK5L8_12570 [Marinicella pacifica]
MSFDLFILLDESTSNLQQMWVEKMKQVGVDVKFPHGFDIGKEEFEDVSLEVRFIPPLMKTATEFESFEFNFDFIPITQESRDDYLECVESIEMKEKIKSMTIELQLYSQSGRSDMALIFQCFAAACLVDAGKGVLFDPQEFGAIDGTEVYKVAKAHCHYELEQINGAQSNVSASTDRSSPNNKYKTVKLWVAIVLGALALDGIWHVFLK